jgi:hypothetical protein
MNNSKEELGIDISRDAAALFDSVGGISQHACAFVIGTGIGRLLIGCLTIGLAVAMLLSRSTT